MTARLSVSLVRPGECCAIVAGRPCEEDPGPKVMGLDVCVTHSRRVVDLLEALADHGAIQTTMGGFDEPSRGVRSG